jgi:hypothetical protein
VTLHLGQALATEAAAGDAWVEALVRAFGQAVETQGLAARARVRCVLTGDIVRYAVVPWREDLSRPAERQVLAQQQFVETHGDRARRWTVCLQPARYGEASLAAGFESAALERLAAAAQARGLRMVSVQPALTEAFNAARKQIDGDGFWFVLVELHWMTLLLVSAREPRHVKRVPQGAGSLAALLDREWFVLGIEAPRCPVYVVHTAPRGSEVQLQPAMGSAASTSWEIVDLTPSAAVGAATSLAA